MPALRPIAFYLPQYHPTPENNQWWGAGFTEWTNVRKAQPRFPGHHQPHVPERLGYYDLRDAEPRRAQAELAKASGIHGFCYYHYWFNGKRLLETPFNEVLKSGEPKLPFCLCWANENWTRRWDGLDREVLMAQQYSHEDDLAFITSLIPAFQDDRYIRVNGKPLLLLYRSCLLPDPNKTSEIWREAMHKAGVGDLYLVRVENNVDQVEVSPSSIGFDAAVEFAPHWKYSGGLISDQVDLFPEAQQTEPDIYNYDKCMLAMLARPKPYYKLFRGIFPAWDNSARRKFNPGIFVNSSPEKYAFWLSQIARYALENFEGDERLIFVNAWNEWGEGCHLEPDEKHGLQYLEATRNALWLAEDIHAATSRIGACSGSLPFDPEKWAKLLSACYAGREHLSDEEVRTVAAFGPYALFTMLPMLDECIRSQFDSIIKTKDQNIKDLHDSLSWRISAPLRALYDKFLK